MFKSAHLLKWVRKKTANNFKRSQKWCCVIGKIKVMIYKLK